MELDDEDLLELLDLNGFESSPENLEMLKEGIYNGDVDFLDVSGISLDEGADPDYGWMQILDKNDFEMTENNVKILKEGCDNGNVMLFTEWWLGDRIRKHKTKKLRRKRMQDYNAKRKAEKEAEAESSAETPEQGSDAVPPAQSGTDVGKKQ